MLYYTEHSSDDFVFSVLLFYTLVNLLANVAVADVRGIVSYLSSMELKFLPWGRGGGL